VNLRIVHLMALGTDRDAEWLGAFHAGRQGVLEGCYRDHFDAVSAAAGKILRRADAETVVHEVFFRLLSNAEFRAKFSGGNVGAWLSRVTTNHAIDYRRKHSREAELPSDAAAPLGDEPAEPHDALAAKAIVDQFRRERLPAKWQAVFEARFLKQLGQREAAAALGMHRTTLMYQEHRIRALLRRFVLKREER
jgi:RNA polymerase sigma-70 factor (ECF subfamily)